jgi:glycosyltransferase involved in cell wall biosynthesis
VSESPLKTAAVVFPDEWLPYSPTVLNLLQCLKEKGYKTTVVTVRSSMFSNFEAYERDVAAFRIPRFLRQLPIQFPYQLLKLLLFLLFHRRTIRRADLCFAVDSLGFVVARLLGKNPYYVSLEAVRDVWLRLARRLGIRHVLIQTPERYEWLFGDAPNAPPYSMLPNAPILEPRPPAEQTGNDLVYLGYVSATHGVEACIGALEHLPERFRLTVRGPGHADYLESLQTRHRLLIDRGRLTVDPSYIPPEEVVPYLSRFAAGFCFYDFNLIRAGDFNYTSCPSGKLFNYLAAGVPVIGSDILGLKVVRERQCGVLLADPTAAAIADAVRVIESGAEGYRRRCLDASAAFDFRTHFERFHHNIAADDRDHHPER